MTKTATTTTKITTWITVVAMITGLAVVAAIYWNKNLKVQDVIISGTYFTEKDEVRKLAEYTKGISPDSLDLQKLTAEIERLNYIKTVSPYVEPSGKLRLQVSEREPLALLINGSDRMYVDETGVKLQILSGKTRNLPLLYGFDAESLSDTLKSYAFTQVRDFLLEAKRNEFGWNTISEVAFDQHDGVVALSFENGVKLLFGKGEFHEKLQNWEAFYAQIIRTKGISKVQQVDLRFKDQVVTHEI